MNINKCFKYNALKLNIWKVKCSDYSYMQTLRMFFYYIKYAILRMHISPEM